MQSNHAPIRAELAVDKQLLPHNSERLSPVSNRWRHVGLRRVFEGKSGSGFTGRLTDADGGNNGVIDDYPTVLVQTREQ